MKEYIEVIVCPVCKSDFKFKDGDKKLVCSNADCACRYLIDNGIPVLLVGKAERPCPKCGEQRDWNENDEILVCTKCGSKYKHG